MIIKGNTVGTTMPRANWNQNDPKKADYIIGKEIVDKAIEDAQISADNAQTAADNAHEAADNAQATADNAQTAADNAQAAADNAQTAADNAQATADNAATKEYVDAKRKEFSFTLTVNDWVGDAAPFTQTIGIEGILATDKPHYSAVYSDDQETRLAQKEAYALVDDLDTADGSVTVTCFDEMPAVNIPIQMEVIR